MKRSTTVKISFTAHGTKRNDTGTGEVSGTVTIFYLNDSASDIVYNTTAGKVTLDPKDFNEAYKQATGSKTAPSNLTIEFQNVPSKLAHVADAAGGAAGRRAGGGIADDGDVHGAAGNGVVAGVIGREDDLVLAVEAGLGLVGHGAQQGGGDVHAGGIGPVHEQGAVGGSHDITYNTTAGKVTLSAQDFIDAYKEATGSKTAPSNLTIEFQNVPSNGTLTYTGGSRLALYTMSPLPTESPRLMVKVIRPDNVATLLLLLFQLDSQVRSKIGNSRYDYYKLRFGSVGNSRDDGYLDANTRTDYYKKL